MESNSLYGQKYSNPVVVLIESCTNCAGHQWFTHHQQINYDLKYQERKDFKISAPTNAEEWKQEEGGRAKESVHTPRSVSSCPVRIAASRPSSSQPLSRLWGQQVVARCLDSPALFSD